MVLLYSICFIQQSAFISISLCHAGVMPMEFLQPFEFVHCPNHSNCSNMRPDSVNTQLRAQQEAALELHEDFDDVLSCPFKDTLLPRPYYNGKTIILDRLQWIVQWIDYNEKTIILDRYKAILQWAILQWIDFMMPIVLFPILSCTGV